LEVVITNLDWQLEFITNMKCVITTFKHFITTLEGVITNLDRQSQFITEIEFVITTFILFITILEVVITNSERFIEFTTQFISKNTPLPSQAQSNCRYIQKAVRIANH
jgi:hypothetical protein